MLTNEKADETTVEIHRGTEQTSMTPLGYGERTGALLGRHGSKGLAVGRFVAGCLRARRQGGAAEAAAWVERRWKDRKVAGAVQKALNTTGTATGGALIPQAFVADWIELLRAETVVRKAEPVFYEMPAGNLTIPRLAGGATAAYQGELDDIIASQETFDDLQLNAKKLTALVPVSNDLLRRAPFDMDAALRDDLTQTVARKEDIAYLVGDGSLGSPVGLLNLCPLSQRFLVQPFSAYDNDTLATQTVGTLRSLRTIMTQNMSRMIRPTWISVPQTFAFLRGLRDDLGGFLLREEMDNGSLLGARFFETQQLASNLVVSTGSGSTVSTGAYLFLVDFADVIVADTMKLEIDVSTDASYTDSSGSTVSTFTRDQSMYRAIVENDFAVRHLASILVATLPGWMPAGSNAGPGDSPYFTQALSGDGSAAASTWGTVPTGSSNPGNNAAVAPGGTLAGRA